ncbi:hypothetical protein SAMN02910353_03025 [Ruminococcus sp. YRD2003]|uniref:hypothetical protein n=1 Tax=Ruminococcus sp. YRD2003 TaxID=1452313 RepID=UPI0008C149E9|nr:hypothetical protein SAMN02910353_03025 [Ruminococcus flavefaciens]
MLRTIDKRIYLMLMTALTISGFIVICTLGQSIHRQKLASRISVTAPEPTVVCEVREYNGRIGLFKDGSSAPYRVIDYDVALMPDFDREQLREGVVMETEEELRRFMEDIAT